MVNKIKVRVIVLLATLFIACASGIIATAFAKNIIQNDDAGINLSPVIVVDYQGYEKENIPVATINKPYKVFSATAELLKGIRNFSVGMNSEIKQLTVSGHAPQR